MTKQIKVILKIVRNGNGVVITPEMEIIRKVKMCIRDSTYPALKNLRISLRKRSSDMRSRRMLISTLWSMSVSYTHLDVYKRQVVTVTATAMSNSFLFIFFSFCR